jgi:phytanoyl-CoA hydroxylase
VIGDDEVEFYREQGYLHVEGVYDRDEVEEMRAGVERIIARAIELESDRSHTWEGSHLTDEERSTLVLKGYHDLPYHDSCFTRAVLQERLGTVLEGLIGPDVVLHHSKMLVKPPERGAPFPMHQDYPYFPHARHTMLAASVHLDDADEENGCLHVVPGSHKLGPLEPTEHNQLDRDEFPVESGAVLPASAGDVVFFNYLTIHGSGINTSERTRRNVLFQFRAADDLPVVNTHVNWGAGLVVRGANPLFHRTRPHFSVERIGLAEAEEAATRS